MMTRYCRSGAASLSRATCPAIAALGIGVAGAAFAACFVAGAILTPVSQREHMPFAAIGFASVVSLMPGVYIFRMAGGLVQIAGASATTPAPLSAIIWNGMTALMIILAMSLGLIASKMLIESFQGKRQRIRSPQTKEPADARQRLQYLWLLRRPCDTLGLDAQL